MTPIDDYFANLDPRKRKHLERIREIAKETVPDAGEVISYGMPALTYKGKAFLGFNIHKNHVGIYPYGGEEIEKLKDKLSAYKVSKGAIQVPYDSPIPKELLQEIIKLRIARIEGVKGTPKYR
ncbi:MAG: DUF1801 domain-containing protein [Patescibacteria group bacterium]|nr:DUF1801 domain-containing protein [Patescibacteria group bacterium]